MEWLPLYNIGVIIDFFSNKLTNGYQLNIKETILHKCMIRLYEEMKGRVLPKPKV